jgi:hypothetical protein
LDHLLRGREIDFVGHVEQPVAEHAALSNDQHPARMVSPFSSEAVANHALASPAMRAPGGTAAMALAPRETTLPRRLGDLAAYTIVAIGACAARGA